MKDGCQFCDYRGPSEILHDFGGVIVFEPLNPVTEGHVLVVPKQHIISISDDPGIAGLVIVKAASYVAVELDGGDYNLIVSQGRAATQTVRHLHLHVIPRREGDGLALPWTNQEAR